MENEIKYPYYTATIVSVFKALSIMQCICISTFEGREGINLVDFSMHEIGEPCTELEYSLAFKKVSDILKSK